MIVIYALAARQRTSLQRAFSSFSYVLPWRTVILPPPPRSRLSANALGIW